MKNTGYISAESIYYETTLQGLKKSRTPLQPIYEAFTNSLESIKILKDRHHIEGNGTITVHLFKQDAKQISSEKEEYDIDRIEIIDTGVGFEDEEFNRLIALNDNRKGFHNKGTGRVQFLHSFAKTKIFSVYRDETSSTGFRQHVLTLSKDKKFIEQNAIIHLDEGNKEESQELASSTCVTFEGVLVDKDRKKLSSLSLDGLKADIISRYLVIFCNNIQELPNISFKLFINGKYKEETQIDRSDIPAFDKKEKVEICYRDIRAKEPIKLERKEEFELTTFKIPKDKLSHNKLNFICKGEVVEDSKMKLGGLLDNDVIDGNRYLFLLSGSYINDRDSDARGSINIPRKSDLQKNTDMSEEAEIVLLDDIEKVTNSTIENLYDEIKAKLEDKKDNIKELQKMFLLNKNTLSAIKISVNDTDDSILKKVYKADAEIIARKDAEIKRLFEGINELNPASKEYQDQLAEKVSDFVTVIPQQNRTSLTHYVARRKLVLEVFDRIFSKQLESLKNGGRIDEDVMHNLIFQQSSTNPENSDLWLIEEDFIYFNGCSEKRLSLLEIEGEKVFKDMFTEEEEKYLNSLNEKRLIKRPDILLFPDEGKCIIIELKAPDVNVSEYLTQIDFYASLIRNNTVDKFQINTFYGYLVGEGIEDKDVRGRVSSFEHSYHLDYWFRPSEKVIGFDGKSDGSIYTEVIKYSTLLERAKRRNKIFIEKITQ